MVSLAVVISKDTAALTPARSSLGQLLATRARLLAEADPLNQRLMRLDARLARIADEQARVARLEADHVLAVADALAAGRRAPKR